MITLERFPSVSSGIAILLSLLWVDGSAAAASFSKVATGNFESFAGLPKRRLQVDELLAHHSRTPKSQKGKRSPKLQVCFGLF